MINKSCLFFRWGFELCTLFYVYLILFIIKFVENLYLPRRHGGTELKAFKIAFLLCLLRVLSASVLKAFFVIGLIIVTVLMQYDSLIRFFERVIFFTNRDDPYILACYPNHKWKCEIYESKADPKLFNYCPYRSR